MASIHPISNHPAAIRRRILRAETRRVEDAFALRRYRIGGPSRVAPLSAGRLRSAGPFPMAAGLWRGLATFHRAANDDRRSGDPWHGG